jgi:transposase
MRPYPQSCSVPYWDNCAIHKTPDVRSLIDALGASPPCSSVDATDLTTGARSLHTPPYSPDFQPMELIFTVFKARLRQLGALHRPGESTEDGLKRIFTEICTRELVRKCFRACRLV